MELYEKLTVEEKKTVGFTEIKKVWKDLSDEEKRGLREKWKIKLNKKKEQKHVVLFGNGLFPTGGGGYPCVPRKRFLRYLASKGVVVILDEFRTSKCCPGCHLELEDIEDKKRVRRCQNDQSVTCPLLSDDGKAYEADRDVIATVNMAVCSNKLLLNGKRPDYLSRPKSVKGSVEHEQEKLSNEYSCLS